MSDLASRMHVELQLLLEDLPGGSVLLPLLADVAEDLARASRGIADEPEEVEARLAELQAQARALAHAAELDADGEVWDVLLLVLDVAARFAGLAFRSAVLGPGG